MLSIALPETSTDPVIEIELEHSLVSLSKWEAVWEKPFHSREEKTEEESKSYAHCMLVTPNVSADVFERFNSHHYRMILNHINSKQSATTFNERETKRGQPEAITAELIYYWMISFKIPFDPCENWHLNRLMTLIKIAGVKQAPPKKMSRQEIAAQQRRLNAERRDKLGTSG